MKTFQKSNVRIFLFCILGAFILQSSSCPPPPEPEPKADFTASATTINVGESITFTDASTGTVTARNWQIAGGTPNSSTATSVTSQFNTEGSYAVSLTATNGTASNTKGITITVKPAMFLHTTSSSNNSSNWTTIDNPTTNNKPNAVLIVTANWGTAGPYHNKAIGVWYNNGKWTVYNQDLSTMPSGVRFNVLVKDPSDKAAVVTASSISGHVAILSHPSLNGNPNAKLLATQNYGSSGPYNNNPIGVYYTGTNWAVYNQNFAAMPTNAKFNVVIDDKIFVVTASAPVGNTYDISYTATDNLPDALVFATQYWTSVYNAAEIGVWYHSGKWSIFNQNIASMPANAKFMVLSNKQ